MVDSAGSALDADSCAWCRFQSLDGADQRSCGVVVRGVTDISCWGDAIGTDSWGGHCNLCQCGG